MSEQQEVRYLMTPDWPGYRVGDDGSVWTQRKKGNPKVLSSWRRRSLVVSTSGYYTVMLRRLPVAGKVRYCLCYVHRLVLEAFVGPCPEGMECCHRDGDRLNNRLENLRWDTPKGNASDNILNGTHHRGEAMHNATLTEKDIRIIRYLRRVKLATCASIALVIGTPERNVAAILRGESWIHVSDDD